MLIRLAQNIPSPYAPTHSRTLRQFLLKENNMPTPQIVSFGILQMPVSTHFLSSFLFLLSLFPPPVRVSRQKKKKERAEFNLGGWLLKIKKNHVLTAERRAHN